jgi:UDP-3-O-[3-hydroxymyristoyl] glucosamine N-acyltransferase
VSFTLKQLAEWAGGELAGDGNTTVRRLQPLTDAEAGDLTLVDGDRNAKAWAASPATAAVVPPHFPADARPLIRVREPFAAFQNLLLRIRGTRTSTREIHPSAVIHPTATLGPNASVGPLAVVGEGTVIGANVTLHPGAVVGRFCTLGDDVTIFPRAVIYDDCTLGSRVTLHAGAVIGADGFGYKFVNGKHEKVPQIGTVVIEDDVEIGANSTVDRATLGTTRIGAGTKIDNLVMVSHNCRIGRHNILAGQVGIAGSCGTGDYVVMGGQVGVADHCHIGAGAVLAAQSGVISDIEPSARMFGMPAMPGRDFFKMVAYAFKVPALRKEVERIKAQLGIGDTE